MRYNSFNQPLGELVENDTKVYLPKIGVLVGDSVRIEKINQSHFEDLYKIYGENSPEENFTYMSFSKFNDKNEFNIFFKKCYSQKILII